MPYRVMHNHFWIDNLEHELKPSVPYSVVVFLTDASIAAMMCYLLHHHRTEYAQ
jgi:hypothetical protein